MITYTKTGDRITLEMSVDDYDNLLLNLGYQAGRLSPAEEDDAGFYRSIAFVNELNRTNPNFTPYQIPADFYARRSDAE